MRICCSSGVGWRKERTFFCFMSGSIKKCGRLVPQNHSMPSLLAAFRYRKTRPKVTRCVATGRPARANRATDTRAKRPCHYRLKNRFPQSDSKHIRLILGCRNLPPSVRNLRGGFGFCFREYAGQRHRRAALALAFVRRLHESEYLNRLFGLNRNFSRSEEAADLLAKFLVTAFPPGLNDRFAAE